MNTIAFNDYAKQIYAWNVSVGWWDDPDRCMFQTMQLISTEVAEATEGERKDLMDKHLPHRKGGEVELADALIRALDIAGRHLIFDYKLTVDPWASSSNPTIGKQHLGINRALIEFADAGDFFGFGPWLGAQFGKLVGTIVFVSVTQGYDLEGAMIEKMAFNKTRLDHKREARSHFDGKKF